MVWPTQDKPEIFCTVTCPQNIILIQGSEKHGHKQILTPSTFSKCSLSGGWLSIFEITELMSWYSAYQ